MNEDAKHEPLAIEHARAVGKATGAIAVIVFTLDDDGMGCIATWGADRRACASASKSVQTIMRRAVPQGVETINVVAAEDPDDNDRVKVD